MQAKACSTIAALMAFVVLAGCIGPKYKPPAAPAPPAFKESAPAAYKNALPGMWQPARPQDAEIKGKWWEMFGEPELNGLEEQLNINNQNIAQYFQNFMAARAQVSEVRSQYFPTVTAAPTVTRARVPTNVSGAPRSGSGAAGSGTTGAPSVSSDITFTQITLPIDVSWEPDLWGRVRKTVQEYRYAAQVSAADLENERLTEQAALAAYYFQLRGQDALQALYDKTVESYQTTLNLTRALAETGIESEQAVAEAEVTLADAQEARTIIAANRAIFEHAIATLTGKAAPEFSMPVRALTTPVPAIPVGVPSDLLQRRPDIAAAERTMAEANALIGVEKTAYYPTLSLTGSGGLEGTTLKALFSVPAMVWSVGASASETIFDAGLRRATVAQYTAQYNADVASYKQTVLTAFQQVEDYIATLRVNSEGIIQLNQAVEAAQRSVDFETTRYQTGIDPYLNVMTAQIVLLTNQQTQVTLRVNEMTAAVELVQALGGGWNVSELPAASKITSKKTPVNLSSTP